MKIERFWARGFRSLRSVEMADLGAFNVLYGKNGSGKSNILAAIGLLPDLLRAQTCIHKPTESCPEAVKAVLKEGIVRRHDLYARDDSKTVVVGAHFVGTDPDKAELVSGPLRFHDLTVEVTLEWIVESAPRVFMTKLESGGQDLRTSVAEGERSHLVALLCETLPPKAYTLVGAERFIDEPPAPSEEGEKWRNQPWHLRGGGLAQVLLRAQIDSRPAVRQRLEGLRKLLDGPPLHRPPFFPVQNAETGKIILQERLAEPNPDGMEIPVDLAGLGIAQVYVILAQATLSGARVVGIEEPEAHLHAPTTGLHLRDLLRRLVNDKYIDQLFIATHSNVFDLDETGFWDVRLENGETVVLKKPLDEIDRHLYEPGPTLHAFEELLRLSDPDRVMSRRADGTPVSAGEMLALLRSSDPVALDYLKDLHRAAVDVVGLRARRKVAAEYWERPLFLVLTDQATRRSATVVGWPPNTLTMRR